MNLYKFTIKTYFYGNVTYTLYVLAETEGSATNMVYDYPKFKHDEDAKIISIDKIDTSVAGII